MGNLAHNLFQSKYNIIGSKPKLIGRYLREIGFEKGTFRIMGWRMGKLWRIPVSVFFAYGETEKK
jgi:hypothetical protein